MCQDIMSNLGFMAVTALDFLNAVRIRTTLPDV